MRRIRGKEGRKEGRKENLFNVGYNAIKNISKKNVPQHEDEVYQIQIDEHRCIIHKTVL